MEVIAVGGVVIGREHGAEYPAGPLADIAQEAAFGAFILPVLSDVDDSAAFDREARNINCVRESMLAQAAQFLELTFRQEYVPT